MYLLRAFNHSIIRSENLNTSIIISSNINYVHIPPVVPKTFVMVGYLGDDQGAESALALHLVVMALRLLYLIQPPVLLVFILFFVFHAAEFGGVGVDFIVQCPQTGYI